MNSDPSKGKCILNGLKVTTEITWVVPVINYMYLQLEWDILKTESPVERIPAPGLVNLSKIVIMKMASIKFACTTGENTTNNLVFYYHQYGKIKENAQYPVSEYITINQKLVPFQSNVDEIRSTYFQLNSIQIKLNRITKTTTKTVKRSS